MEENTEKRQRHEARRGNSYYTEMPDFPGQRSSKFWHHMGRSVRVFIVIAACIAFYFALLRVTNLSNIFTEVYQVLKPVIYGLAIAYLLNPIVKSVDRYLEPFLRKKFPGMKKTKQVSRGAGIFLALIVLVVIIVALCNMLIPELYRSIRDMVITVPAQLNRFIDEVTRITSENGSTLGQMTETILKEASNMLQTWMRNDLLAQVNIVMSNLTVGVINILKELFYALVGVIVSVYVLFSKEKFCSQCKKIVYALFRPDRANMILHLTIKSNEMFGGFIIGKIIDSAIIGFLCFIGLSVLNMPYTLLVSVIVGTTNVIPFFGPYIGAIPSAILILLTDPRMGIYFIIFVFLLQQLDGNIIGPKILGNSTGLSAFWVVFSILFGGGMFGVIGMILGVPTFAVIYYIVNMLLNHRLQKRSLPTETSAYSEKSYVDNQGVYVDPEHFSGTDDQNTGADDQEAAK